MQPSAVEVIVRCDGAEARRVLRREPDGWTVIRPLLSGDARRSAVARDVAELADALIADLAAGLETGT